MHNCSKEKKKGFTSGRREKKDDRTKINFKTIMYKQIIWVKKLQMGNKN